MLDVCPRCNGLIMFDRETDGCEWAKGFHCVNCGYWEWINHVPSKVVPRLTQRGKYARPQKQ